MLFGRWTFGGAGRIEMATMGGVVETATRKIEKTQLAFVTKRRGKQNF